MVSSTRNPESSPPHRTWCSNPIIFNDLPVLQSDTPPGSTSDFCCMGDHNNRATLPMNIFKQRQDLVASISVKRSRRLVCQNKSRFVHDSSGDYHPLLLSARELVWPMVAAVCQSDARERVFGSATPFRPANAGINKRQLDIFQSRCSGQERWNLEYKANISAPDDCT
jgi:hypothetical protein